MLGTHAWHACFHTLTGNRQQELQGAGPGETTMGSKRCGCGGRAWTQSVFCAPCLSQVSGRRPSVPAPPCLVYALPSLLPLRPRFSTCSHLYKMDNSKTPTRPTNQTKHHHAAGASLSKSRRAWGAAKRLLTHVSWHMAAGRGHIARDRLHKLYRSLLHTAPLLTCYTALRSASLGATCCGAASAL